MADLQTQLEPLAISGSGFLGKGELLSHVIAADTVTLEALGVTHDQIAARLQYFADRTEKCGVDVQVDEMYIAKSTVSQGYQGCPWRDGRKTDLDIDVTNIRTSRKVRYSGLLPHLISEHHFFEGRGTSYRLDPLEAVLVLDIPTPIMTREEVEERLCEELIQDLASDYKVAQEHAIKSLAWFAKRIDVPSHLAVYARDKLLGDTGNMFLDIPVGTLIETAKELPADNKLDGALYEVISDIENDADICGFVRRDLMRFKREREGDIYPNIIRKFYWPDLVEFARIRWGEDHFSRYVGCITYVEEQGILVEDVARRGTEFFADYGKRLLEEKPLKQMIEEDGAYLQIEKMQGALPYLNGTDTSIEAREKQRRFYAFAKDLAALNLLPELFSKMGIQLSATERTVRK
jgi:hypothetical protein